MQLPGRFIRCSQCVLFLFLVTGCDAKGPVVKATKKRLDVNYLPTLRTAEDFLALQGEPLSSKFNIVLSIKVVYELRSEKIYFINSARYRYHYNFCSEALGYSAPLESFNSDNYGDNNQRQYFLANLNYYKQSGIYALEFVSDDKINATQLATFFAAVRQATFIKDSVRLLVGTDYLLKLDNAGKLNMAKAYASDIYKGQHYQPLNTGTAYGILKMLPSLEDAYKTVEPEDVIIIKGTPLNVPVCAGIITNNYQTPLSHINILCHSRNIPSAVEEHSWEDAQIKALVGKPVRLDVFADSFRIQASTLAEVAAKGRQSSTKKVLKLKLNARRQQLLPGQELSLASNEQVGNKAAGVGELYKMARQRKSSFSVPEGIFAIPFYWYQQHILNPAVKKEIDALLDHPALLQDKIKVHAQLKKIRKAIKELPADSHLIAAVAAMIQANNVGPSYRFRSSSNAEDKVGFSGAGLYESKTGILRDSVKSIEKAIKAVWASIWDDAPFAERDFYNIDHRTAMMGILCHRNFPDEAANGVAITRNLYRKGFPGFTVNVQAGEVSVVSPPNSVTCEQFICLYAAAINPENTDVTVDYLTYSNITNGKPVLSHAQITKLYQALQDVKTHFYFSPMQVVDEPFEDYALDVEFKFEKNGKLYLKQARPYR